jgi:uncharacterized protein (DUF1800 family)
MPLYGCLTPDGYKNTEDAWLSPDATTRRIGFATALARGGLGFSADKNPVEARHLEAIFGATMASATQDVVKAAPPALGAALILGSPDFMDR